MINIHQITFTYQCPLTCPERRGSDRKPMFSSVNTWQVTWAVLAWRWIISVLLMHVFVVLFVSKHFLHHYELYNPIIISGRSSDWTICPHFDAIPTACVARSGCLCSLCSDGSAQNRGRSTSQVHCFV